MPFDLRNIREDMPSKGKILSYWLTGSGFVFKFDNGQIICVDPYLSDYTARLLGGYKRLNLAPVTVDELYFDLLLISHEHPDHMDVDSFDMLMRTNPDSHVIVSEACRDFIQDKKISYEIMRVGSVSQHGGLTVRGVQADHGELSPKAIAYMIEYNGRSIYFTADTSDDPEILADNIQRKPEIIIPCINGKYGNLNEEQAARLAGKCESKVAIPCHYWLFAEHGGSPRRFGNYLKDLSPKTELVLLTPGLGEEV